MSQSYGDIDTQAILAELNTPEPSAVEATPDVAPAAAPPPEPRMFEFDWNGKQVRGNEDEFRKWASQGYDYSQRMQQLNQQARESEEKYSKYREIDEFALQNPEWWQYVEQNWQQKDHYNLAPEFQKVLQPLQQELSTMKQFVNQWQQEKLQEQAKAEDAKLHQEITGLQQKYPDVDFASKDELGQSLEYRVIKHANEKGIPTFTSAFLDYYQDNLAKIFEARGRQAVEAERKKQREQGLLGISQAPERAQYQGTPKTYDDAFKAALADLGL